ncbi:11501_t:CDS:2 [Entrophospora sp. SA101]|nr:4957_t:CDS:2 [Entrophospora sp. SA101]CAJ0900655.1 11501_t:CDS:2 [Entrophospora sp. SA101]
MSFVYSIPTTGSISFSEFLLDQDKLYLNGISEATAQRGRVRAVLKEANKTEGPIDYTKIIKTVDDYLPYLLAIVDCLECGQLKLKKEIETSWRCSLTDSVLNKKKKPRVSCKGIYYELIFTLLTYGYTCSDWATSIIERQTNKDEMDLKLRQAADLLRKASGIFAYITENISPRWENPPNSRPLDVLTEISTSLSKIALADASSIAIRKALMQQKSSSLLAKLAIGVAVEYESANGLLNSLKDPQKVCGNFRKYVSNGALFHQQRMPTNIRFIKEAREAFHQISKSKSSTLAIHASQEYTEITFDTVPSRADLQALIPGGRIVQELTKYSKPDPAFGPYKEQQIESAALNSLPFVSYFAN